MRSFINSTNESSNGLSALPNGAGVSSSVMAYKLKKGKSIKTNNKKKALKSMINNGFVGKSQ